METESKNSESTLTEQISTVDHLRDLLKRKDEEIDSLKKRLFHVETVLDDVAKDFKDLRMRSTDSWS